MAARKATRSGRDGSASGGTGRKAGSRSARKRSAGKSGKAAKKSRRPSKAAKQSTDEKLYTLTEVGKMASVSMPTLQKYKKRYADRIPSVGEGRRQRYPKAAVAVLKQLKKENLAKRGRPPKAGGKKKKAARGGARSSSDLLTLTEISKRTKISYPTVSRYVKLFLDRIPHEGSGRKRRFPQEAVKVFEQLRRESRPGRPKSSQAKAGRGRRGGRASDAALMARLTKLEKSQADLRKQLSTVVKLLKKPVQVTIKRS